MSATSQNFPNLQLWLTSAVAGAAVLGSMYMYQRVRSLEEQIDEQNRKIEEKNQYFQSVISELENRTNALNAGTTQEAKISSIQ